MKFKVGGMEYEPLPVGAYAAWISEVREVTTKKGDNKIKIIWTVESPDEYKGRTIHEYFPMPQGELHPKSWLYQRAKGLLGDFEELDLDQLLIKRAKVTIGINDGGYTNVAAVMPLSDDDWDGMVEQVNKPKPQPVKDASIEDYYQKLLKDGPDE